jgi:hypothetical protein
MKQVFVYLLLLLGMALTANPTLEIRLDRYAGTNAASLKALLTTLPADTLQDVQFLLENASDPDLAVLTPEFLVENVRLAHKTRSLPFLQDVPDDVFQHFVLPPRIAQEPFEPYRAQLFKELLPLVQDCPDIESAITIINLWCAQKMTFLSTNGRDQGPLTTIRRMKGRCEEMMILFIAAARSVGIPARSAYVPYWNFTDNNHAWTEVWTPSGWKFLGSGEPANRLSDTWFTQTTTRATLVLSEAYGDFSAPDVIHSENGVLLLNTTDIYTHPKPCAIMVMNSAGKPVAKAKVTLYAASYGGEMDMLSLTTDEAGHAKINLGSGAVWVTAVSDSLFAQGVLDTMADSPRLSLVLKPGQVIDTSFNLRFPLPQSVSGETPPKPVFDDFATRKELADLRIYRNQKDHSRPLDFLPFCDPNPGETTEDYKERRDGFLDRCADLGYATDDYLHLLQMLSTKSDSRFNTLKAMLETWDVKDLVELPDTTTMLGVIGVYTNAKGTLPDSLFRDNILGSTFSQRQSPETGWEPALYQQVANLKGADIASTVTAVRKWIDQATVRDDSLRFSYFTGAMTPMQYLNMHRLPQGYRTVLTASALKVLGVPVRWRGFLEYWDGTGFVPVASTDSSEKSESREERSFTINMTIDGKSVIPAEFENFFVGEFDGETVSATYFDFNKQTNTVSMSVLPKHTYYLEAMVRNGNGDANVRIVTINEGSHYDLQLVTPREYNDETTRWSESTRKALAKQTRKWGHADRAKVVIVLNRTVTEPQTRIFTEIEANRKQWNNIDVLVYSDGGASPLLSGDQAQVYSAKSGPSWIDVKDMTGDPSSTGFIQQNYPLVFLLDAKGTPVFSSRGYQMGLGGLLSRKIGEMK